MMKFPSYLIERFFFSGNNDLNIIRLLRILLSVLIAIIESEVKAPNWNRKLAASSMMCYITPEVLYLEKDKIIQNCKIITHMLA